ncbi:MAG TPA: hypothetical protein VIE65_20555, partial [Methylobacter sp.]
LSYPLNRPKPPNLPLLFSKGDSHLSSHQFIRWHDGCFLGIRLIESAVVQLKIEKTEAVFAGLLGRIHGSIGLT